jgi:hypothetical protein
VIRFQLRCGHGHEFEGWFRDNAAFDRQAASGHLTCPDCGDARIDKAIMAPSVVRTDREPPAKPSQQVAVPTAGGGSAPVVAPDAERAAKLRALVQAIKQHVEQNFDDVGERFPEEARKIHYGETEDRGIYGQASHDEVKELLEEGIEVHPLPTGPKLQG